MAARRVAGGAGAGAGARAARRTLPALAAVALLAAGCGPREEPAPDGGGSCDTCPADGVAECQADTTDVLRTCAPGADGCLRWEAARCLTGDLCEAGACIPCTGEAGTFSGRTLLVDGETRYYYLHVPAAYDCSAPWPLLMDHHGTAGPPAPEEAWALSDAVAAADREGYILVRPRSRSSLENGYQIYRWDQNTGDPQRNLEYVLALLDDLKLRYRIDPARTYVSGFSSGTNQTSTVLADALSPFKGYGFFGGGAWSVDAVPASAATARFFLTSGYRDYMRSYHYNLVALLDAAGVPDAQRLVRDTDSGHDLYGWMYDEMWPFLDRGERPPAGALASGWTEEPLPAAVSLNAGVVLAGGDLVAGGADATLMRRSAATGAWSALSVAGTTSFASEGFAGVCVTAGGFGLATGNGLQATTADGGDTWAFGAVPDVSTSPFGYMTLEAAGCAGATATTGGYWSGASTNDGAAWTDVTFDYPYGRAMVVSLRAAPWGTWVATGYYAYLGRSDDGVTFSDETAPAGIEWLNDAAAIGAATWIVVAEKGQVVRSDDDGVTWTLVRPGPGDDLYAVAFRDDTTGLAVGRRGAALLTADGGATWTDVGAGVDRYLADVHWLADGTALVLGGGAAALRFDPGI
jgi:predicted esterase